MNSEKQNIRPHASKAPRFFLGVIVLSAIFWAVWTKASNDAPEWTASLTPGNITLAINGFSFFIPITQATTITDLLAEQKIVLADNDLVYPKSDSELRPNSTILIHTAKLVPLLDGIQKTTLLTHGLTIADALAENNIELNELDTVVPEMYSPIEPTTKQITITRVVREIEIKEEVIPFTTKANEDDELGWRVKKVTQKGEKGTKKVEYEVLFKNDKEVKRKITSTEITKEPITEIITQGTFMKLKKANTGWGTWYTQPKNMTYSFPQEQGMTAASPWIGIGQYVKVTNKENGKSVVVRINDRGPFGKNRIIDLNTPAFQKIASLGAGVIDVKVEEILN